MTGRLSADTIDKILPDAFDRPALSLAHLICNNCGGGVTIPALDPGYDAALGSQADHLWLCDRCRQMYYVMYPPKVRPEESEEAEAVKDDRRLLRSGYGLFVRICSRR